MTGADQAAHNADDVLTERQREEGWCCRDSCCGPGSWCCGHANPHEHPEFNDGNNDE